MKKNAKTKPSQEDKERIWNHNNEVMLAQVELESLIKAFDSTFNDVGWNLQRIKTIREIGNPQSEVAINSRIQNVSSSLTSSQKRLKEILELEKGHHVFLGLSSTRLEKLVSDFPSSDPDLKKVINNVKTAKVKLVEFESKLEDHKSKFKPFENIVENNTNIENTGEQQTKNEIFLCHSSKDKPIVLNLYNDLSAAGYKPWIDSLDILAGQDWELEILLAIGRAKYFIVCLSQNAVSREGYTQKEIKLGLDVLDRMPEGKTFLIPVRLDNCTVPERIKSRQWVNLFERGGFERLLKALK